MLKSRRPGDERPPIPGPSPWYLQGPEMEIHRPEGTWTWGFHAGPQLAGLAYLSSPAGEIMLILDFYHYVMPIGTDCILVWHAKNETSDPDAVDGAHDPGVDFVVFALEKLRPIQDPLAAARKMREAKQRMVFDDGLVASQSFALLPEGQHEMSPHGPFAALPEILVLAAFIPVEAHPSNGPLVAVYSLDFPRRTISVFPQRWYNEGNFDFGWEGPWRVWREQSSGQIVGDGTRLPKFRLDATNTQLQR